MMDGIYLRMLFVLKIRTKYLSQYLKCNEFSSLKYFSQSEFLFDLEPSQANKKISFSSNNCTRSPVR